MLTYNEAWSSKYVLSHYRGRALPYNRVDSTDEVEQRFTRECSRLRITATWFPFAGALDYNPNHVTLKTLIHMREEAIESLDHDLLRRAELRLREVRQ